MGPAAIASGSICIGRWPARYIPVEEANAYVDSTDDQPRPLCALDLAARTTRISTWRMPTTGEDPRGIWHRRYYGAGTKMRPPKPGKSG